MATEGPTRICRTAEPPSAVRRAGPPRCGRCRAERDGVCSTGMVDSALLTVLAELRRAASSTQALVRQAPEIIGWLGFDRVLVSRVQHGVWLPESMFVRRDPRWAEAIMAAGRGSSTALDSVVEHDLVLTARPLVVDEVQTHPRVCRPIAEVSRSENYGVAPIIVGGDMVGMLHADCFFQRRDVTDQQCVTLSAVAETLGAHLGRVTVLDQLREIGRGSAPGWDLPPSAPEPAPAPGARPPAPALTPREVEIVELMAAGATNHRIATQLCITVGTARSHVSHILRKLDADNRAHAVAIWLATAAG